jgi:hypothetical protein
MADGAPIKTSPDPIRGIEPGGEAMDFSNLVMFGSCCPDFRSAAKEAKAH